MERHLHFLADDLTHLNRKLLSSSRPALHFLEGLTGDPHRFPERVDSLLLSQVAAADSDEVHPGAVLHRQGRQIEVISVLDVVAIKLIREQFDLSLVVLDETEHDLLGLLLLRLQLIHFELGVCDQSLVFLVTLCIDFNNLVCGFIFGLETKKSDLSTHLFHFNCMLSHELGLTSRMIFCLLF